MQSRRRRPAIPILIATLLALVVTAFAGSASAYPWMIRHDYGSCGVCHADPTGGGVLTEYGRAQGEILLRTHYGSDNAEDGEPSSVSGFLWGAFEPPEWLLLGGSLRGLMLTNKSEGSPADTRFVQMQADLRAIFRKDMVRAGASVGFVHEGAQLAAVTHADKDNLISREHWAGVTLMDEALLVRAGRIALPFGIRNIEHTLWVRTTTRTDINTGQQHGVAVSYSGEDLRGEVMAIAGNFQLNPDDYRERGYAGFLEWTPMQRLSVGVDSLMTTTLLDVRDRVTTFRQAHGAFVRAAPYPPLVLSAEGTALLRSPTGASTSLGYAGMLQGDYEPLQGVHGILTGEIMNEGIDGNGPSLGLWVSSAWFFAPHMDVRMDGIVRNVPAGTTNTNVLSLLLQLHAYL